MSVHTGTGDTQSGDRTLPAAAFFVYRRLISPLLHSVSPTQCRYLPTCSEYAYTAIHRFGAIRGTWLAVRRLLRCHPWSQGGLDPVPQRQPRPIYPLR